ncbi:16S rRNA (guanine(527)-N(7))-methyltransferase RsmG [Aromatoleum petrolei]|uniref:Ribosomal RNA small subunit methyltransferase G n=1 Tax=Aromatoleum petrolei TaxID=76116 RepID=A0ABX1MNZ6_9RHOO|nr:16S rRNA (guanine(527)-N(7))-methyltransferase RsmG [Aromatoleum petrolei]NMF89663.1 16S rRNA (guanine(527)-N(7))-methyltransferase RsmG [Aromatoleum petrolei]QTQ36594.1 Ribosomal RNA small subunit methyltransferase G [Aromatoleum petrolei]
MSAMTLERGLAEMGLNLPADVLAKLLEFAALLQKWNKVYNLTSIRGAGQVITHHLLDSLVVLPHLAGIGRLADIGSGGGLPGIPLAIATAARQPAPAITSIETVNKKASFQQQAKIELSLANFTVLNERVENVRPGQPFDAVISRAFSELADFVGLTQHLLRPGGRFLAMKGVYPHDEIARLPADFRIVEAVPLTVPGLGAERHLIIVEKS